MKKNRLLLMLNVSVVALTPTLYAQEDSTEMVQDQDTDLVTKQQLEEFLTEKNDNAVGASEEAADTLAEQDESVDESTEQSSEDSSGQEEQAEQLSQDESSVQSEEPQEVVEEAVVTQESVTAEALADKAPAKQVAATNAETPAVAEKPVPATNEKPSSAESTVEASEAVEATGTSVQPAPATVDEKTAPAAEVPKEAPVAAPVQQPEVSLLDTIDIEEGGNWVLKRKALQDTVRKIEDINALYDDIHNTNIVFLQGINVVDVLFTQFSYDVGLDLGKVDQLVQDVAHHLESEREEGGHLSEAERELLQKAEERKKEIEQLRANINDIWQAHSQLKEARQLNDEQIIEADRLRKQAWRNFRMIERVLNEEKAEALYHETVQLFESMQGSYRYLQTRLIPHFEQSIKVIREKMNTVKKQSEELQSEGVLLKQEAVFVDKLEKNVEFETEEPVAPSTSWFGSIKNILWTPFAAIGSLWNWITGSSNNMNQYLPDDSDGEELGDAEIQQPDEL